MYRRISSGVVSANGKFPSLDPSTISLSDNAFESLLPLSVRCGKELFKAGFVDLAKVGQCLVVLGAMKKKKQQSLHVYQIHNSPHDVFFLNGRLEFKLRDSLTEVTSCPVTRMLSPEQEKLGVIGRYETELSIAEYHALPSVNVYHYRRDGNYSVKKGSIAGVLYSDFEDTDAPTFMYRQISSKGSSAQSFNLGDHAFVIRHLADGTTTTEETISVSNTLLFKQDGIWTVNNEQDHSFSAVIKLHYYLETSYSEFGRGHSVRLEVGSKGRPGQYYPYYPVWISGMDSSSAIGEVAFSWQGYMHHFTQFPKD